MAKNYIENVAIVGAGGHVGSYMSKALVEGGKHKVTAITRPDSTAKIPTGVARAEVDYSSHDSLVEALKGQDFLIITMNVMAPPGSQEKLVDAALDAGIKFIMPNEYGGKYSDEKYAQEVVLGMSALKVRRYIEEKGGNNMHWIALSCAFWYEFSLSGAEMRFGFDFLEKKLTLFDNGDFKITTSTWDQCGRAVAKLLSLPIEPESPGQLSVNSYKNDAVYISSFYTSQRDMLASVLRVTGQKESEWTITHENSRVRYERGQAMFKQGDFHGFAILLYARMFFQDGSSLFLEDLQNEKLGLPQEDLDKATALAVRFVESGEHKGWVF
ncbi:hypothetical protein BAUCODRAFT_62406 [Baudoinia panamericana UAMH 10762]|uniref:NmrA-like domain-containing protein n=1 Tax=Baudoinia panamericana (strain UAMH 10762) TaxID=717646 RepID=M2NM84_BAUPA|nr:uncharacterized protein BAUCODRAFT_62406 [Baudoinia panamericana UAMH 10762]EMD00615.1 hypothetical protein BAUCODRAFT_62406 [Baudoinia panamericana UAMH 10762]